MRKKMREEWDVAPFPSFARSATKALPGEGSGLAVMAASKHPNEAWTWIKWYCGEKGLTSMAQSGESQPSLRRLALQPGVWLPAENAQGAEALPRNLRITDEGAERVQYRPLPTYFTEGVGNAIQGMYYGVLSGENDPEKTLAKAQENLPGQLRLSLRRVDAPPYPVVPAIIVGVLLVLALPVWVYLPAWRNRQVLTSNERQENRSAYLFLIPWFCGLALTIGPMVYSLLLSFGESDIISPPKWRGLGNYQDIFNPAIDDTLGISLRQTFYFSAISIPLGIGFALALALLLNQKIRAVPMFRALYYLPSLASAVAMSLIWMRLFDKDKGLINAILYGNDGKGFLHIGEFLSRLAGTPGEPINWLGNSKTVIPAFILMGMWGAGGGTIIFLAGLQGISQSYYEAATLDGASNYRKFRSVTLPLLTPTIFFSLITGVIGSLQVFSQSFVMTDGGPDRATMFYMVWLWKTAFGELKMGYASALAWILFAIILIFTVIQLGLAKKWVFYEGELK
jgi:multiple sugar transport system permease protein